MQFEVELKLEFQTQPGFKVHQARRIMSFVRTAAAAEAGAEAAVTIITIVSELTNTRSIE